MISSTLSYIEYREMALNNTLRFHLMIATSFHYTSRVISQT